MDKIVVFMSQPRDWKVSWLHMMKKIDIYRFVRRNEIKTYN